MRVAVIGAGAAGLMAAYAAASRGAQVTVFEKNEKTGKKLYITGKGRCNVTNDSSAEEVLENVVRNSKFLFGAVHRFPPERLMRFFEERGLALKVERGNRVFPVSDKASDVTKCLERSCRECGVRFCLGAEVRSIAKTENGFVPETDACRDPFDAVIVCTGGVSYPATGSTGDGYRFAEEFSVAVTPRRAALCGIVCLPRKEDDLQGLTLKNVSLRAERDGKLIRSFFGEMLFTHFGISGPIALSLSSLLTDLPLREVRLFVDLKPALSEEVLDARLLRDFAAEQNKQMQTALKALLPQRMILPVLGRAGIEPTCPVHSLSKALRASLVRTLKNFSLQPVSLRPVEEGIVTAGGVDVKEVDPKTMQCKKVPGLFFAGEVLDVDAFTGGFNLQIAFSTGFSAGNGAVDMFAK